MYIYLSIYLSIHWMLTGQEEIETCAEMLEQKANRLNAQATNSKSAADGVPSTTLPSQPSKLLICPLFAAQPSAKQMQVFSPTPPGYRKVIISTNIAETSITVSGVRYVVDAGLVKTRKYKSKEGFESLEVVPVSKAQAVQRSGRAGREAKGTLCFGTLRLVFLVNTSIKLAMNVCMHLCILFHLSFVLLCGCVSLVYVSF
jgi:ATP-dependent RNA helicase DHX8/PRP22